ncbi:MAG: tyrosine-protein kinase family protein, partial [Actinobacteria bacterium]|nr:tyrosine-protein kinase family protein [Actinomycetota bacterium]
MTLDSAHLPPVVAVVSPKGGSGKTAVASNLALAFAQRMPSVIVDLDMYSGDVEWAFGVQPTYRIHDVARRLREDSSTELEGMFTS